MPSVSSCTADCITRSMLRGPLQLFCSIACVKAQHVPCLSVQHLGANETKIVEIIYFLLWSPSARACCRPEQAQSPTLRSHWQTCWGGAQTLTPVPCRTQIYNLGNTNPHTVTELVDLLERGLARKAKRRLVPMPATGDVLATFADISAAKEVCMTVDTVKGHE